MPVMLVVLLTAWNFMCESVTVVAVMKANSKNNQDHKLKKCFINQKIMWLSTIEKR